VIRCPIVRITDYFYRITSSTVALGIRCRLQRRDRVRFSRTSVCRSAPGCQRTDL